MTPPIQFLTLLITICQPKLSVILHHCALSAHLVGYEDFENRARFEHLALLVSNFVELLEIVLW